MCAINHLMIPSNYCTTTQFPIIGNLKPFYNSQRPHIELLNLGTKHHCGLPDKM